MRKGGFEPPRLTAPPPQDGASASSATSARGEVKAFSSTLVLSRKFQNGSPYCAGAGAAGVTGVGFAGLGGVEVAPDGAGAAGLGLAGAAGAGEGGAGAGVFGADVGAEDGGAEEAGADGLGVTGEGTGVGAAGAGATGAACLGVFENCCSTELPEVPVFVLMCMVKAIDVIMNMMAHQVVALERNVAAPRGPKAVWLPAPPNAPARSAASPLCSNTTTISRPQIKTCKVTRTK